MPCRICTANDEDALVEQIAEDVWASCVNCEGGRKTCGNARYALVYRHDPGTSYSNRRGGVRRLRRDRHGDRHEAGAG